jgi:hypothetical protein
MELHQPLPLSAFLDYGGDLASLPALEGLAETVVVRRRLCCEAEKHALRAFYRSCVDRWVAGGPDAVGTLGGEPISATQATLSAFAWAAECLGDAALAERFERALPPELFAELIGWANERRARAS